METFNVQAVIKIWCTTTPPDRCVTMYLMAKIYQLLSSEGETFLYSVTIIKTAGVRNVLHNSLNKVM